MKLFKNKNPEDDAITQQKHRHEEFLENLPADIKNAAEYTTNNREEINKSDLVGCYYCLSIFRPDEIWEWIHPGENDEFPMCPYCGIDSIFGDASGCPVTKDFLQEMNKYWFDGDGELINKTVTEKHLRYNGKILGLRNYETEKDKFYTIDFINFNTLYGFIWEVSEGESDFTPAGIAFLNEYYNFQNLAEQYRQSGRQLPPHGGGKSEKERVNEFVKYMNSIAPMETTLFIADSQFIENENNVKPSLDNLDDRLQPPK